MRPATTVPEALPERDDALTGIRYGLLLGAAVLALVLPPNQPVATMARPAATVVHRSDAPPLRAPRFADFRGEYASDDARRTADWVADSGDSQGLHFVILDKRDAKVFLFTPEGMLRAATPVLLGFAAGDHTVAGVGQKPIHAVLPEERTTPAGRFVAQAGRNTTPEDVVWVDYEAAVSMHRVRATDPRERRLERLASPQIDDNRISYGCINMPVAFFDNELWPVFQGGRGLVYVLPEELPLRQVFTRLYDPAQHPGRAVARR